MTRDDVIKAIEEGIYSCMLGDTGETATNVLQAIEALGVRLVPVEPTDSMVESGWQRGGTNIRGIWNEMLLASPLSPDPKG